MMEGPMSIMGILVWREMDSKTCRCRGVHQIDHVGIIRYNQ
jgi:hypothetical protein